MGRRGERGGACGTDVFETWYRYQAYPKFIPAPSPPSCPRGCPRSTRARAHTDAQFVICANLIAPRHRWPLTGIELSAISGPLLQGAISANVICKYENRPAKTAKVKPRMSVASRRIARDDVPELNINICTFMLSDRVCYRSAGAPLTRARFASHSVHVEYENGDKWRR